VTNAQTLIRPRSLWREPESHYLRALQDPWYQTLVLLQHTFTAATFEFWSRRGAKTLHLPLTTGSISSPMGLGSDSKPVCVDLFGVPTYIADSMQFLLEWGCRLNPAGTYYVMPSFRGDDSDATHLSQFFHSEAEICGGLEDVIGVAEEYLVCLARALLEEHSELIASVAGSLDHLERVGSDSGPFSRLTFDEAVDALDDRPEYIDHNDGWRNLRRAGELELLARFEGPVWVTHWDHLAVAFYQADAGRGEKAANADLLLGTGELIGSGERHETGGEVRRALARHEIPTAEYEWYVRMKDVHPLRTSGFGMGVERFLLWVLAHDDIRDLQLLPRAKGVACTP
jgi:asparaginyl-tRNA synthetase